MPSMDIEIELEDEVIEVLQAQADSHGITLEEEASRVLRAQLQEMSPRT